MRSSGSPGPERQCETAGLRRAAIASLVVVMSLLLVPKPAQAQNGLKFFKNYFVTGDYGVAGVGLRNQGVNGIATGTINVPAGTVPPGAEILSAFLYWETVVTDKRMDTGITGAKFDGHDITWLAVPLNPQGTSPCWSSGGGTGSSDGAHRLLAYRADVERLLPVGADGKLSINGAHQVKLPDAGTGNQVPSVAGATLFFVWRDPSPSAPLKSIVVYDGGYTIDQSTDNMALTLKGFYQSSFVAPSAKMTHIVGDGQQNFNETVTFAGAALEPNVFTGSAAPGTFNTGWDNYTFQNLPMPAGASSADLLVSHVGTPFDCLSYASVILATTLQDSDEDGYLNNWEDGTAPLDPNNNPLPNLKAMGANPFVQDIFVQLDYMTTPGYVDNQGNVAAHDHLPPSEVLETVAGMFLNAGPRASKVPGAPNITGPIRIHYDVGTNYQLSNADWNKCATDWKPACAVIPATYTVKRNPIVEEACNGSDCEFPGYHVLGWKRGFRFYRDQLLNANGDPCTPADTACTPRFPRNRKDIFRFGLWAHGLGFGFDDDPATPINEKKIPRRTSGIGDYLGGDFMVTLGFWDNLKGSTFMQISTLGHELGHTLGLKHGGKDADGNLLNNCRPNYQSSMNYLFQTRGMPCDAASSAPACAGKAPGEVVADYSRQALPALGENLLSESLGLGTMTYRTRWYSPVNLLTSKVPALVPTLTQCDGSKAAVPMYRIEGTSVVPPLDWYNDGVPTTPVVQDINFDGTVGSLGPGYNDWLNIDLRQVGGRRNIGGSWIVNGEEVVGALSLDQTESDLGKGDLGKGDLGKGDLGKGDLGKGDLGKGDLGKGDLGKGDLGTPGDFDFDTAVALGNDPNGLKATVNPKNIALSWTAPHVGQILTYEVWRAIGDGITPQTLPSLVMVGTSTTTTFIDATVKNNTTYTYFVLATFANRDPGGPSNYVTVLKK